MISFLRRYNKLIVMNIKYRKRFGKDGLIAVQEVWSNHPVLGSVRRGLKEHQEAAPSRSSLLVSLRLLALLLLGGCEGLAQDCSLAITFIFDDHVLVSTYQISRLFYAFWSRHEHFPKY